MCLFVVVFSSKHTIWASWSLNLRLYYRSTSLCTHRHRGALSLSLNQSINQIMYKYLSWLYMSSSSTLKLHIAVIQRKNFSKEFAIFLAGYFRDNTCACNSNETHWTDSYILRSTCSLQRRHFNASTGGKSRGVTLAVLPRFADFSFLRPMM